jgi:hypothetical protein
LPFGIVNPVVASTASRQDERKQAPRHGRQTTTRRATPQSECRLSVIKRIAAHLSPRESCLATR